MDLLMDPGILAMKTLSKYSVSSATVQILLLFAGAFLVPIGTLLITTGHYADPSIGTAVIGIPNVDNDMMMLEFEMGVGDSCLNVTPCYPQMDDNDMVLVNTAVLFEGKLLSGTGVLSNTITEQLGPISTSNITLQEGVTYAGIVTYRWTSGCEYTTEISYVELDGNYTWNVNFTFPDGSVQGGDVWTGSMFMWSDSNTQVNNQLSKSNQCWDYSDRGAIHTLPWLQLLEPARLSITSSPGHCSGRRNVDFSSEMRPHSGLGGEHLHLEKQHMDRLFTKSWSKHDRA
jgi:hypothetical protein